MHIVVDLPPDPGRYDRMVHAVHARTFVWMRCVAAASLVLSILTVSAQPPLGIALLCCGLAMLLTPPLTRLGSRGAARQANGPGRYVLGPGGIRVLVPGMRTDLSWDAIVEARETGSDFVLYMSKVEVLMVPQQSLWRGQDDELRAFLRRRRLLDS